MINLKSSALLALDYLSNSFFHISTITRYFILIKFLLLQYHHQNLSYRA